MNKPVSQNEHDDNYTYEITLYIFLSFFSWLFIISIFFFETIHDLNHNRSCLQRSTNVVYEVTRKEWENA